MATTLPTILPVLTISQFLWISSLAGLVAMFAAVAAWLYAALRIKSIPSLLGLTGALLNLAWFGLARLFSVDTPNVTAIALHIVLPTLAAVLQAVAVWGLVRANLSRG